MHVRVNRSHSWGTRYLPASRLRLDDGSRGGIIAAWTAVQDDQRRDNAARNVLGTNLSDRGCPSGYTLFTQERGDEAAAKLAAKFADIARDGVEGRGGVLLKLRGDRGALRLLVGA